MGLYSLKQVQLLFACSQKYHFLKVFGFFKPFKDALIANRAEQVELMEVCCLSEERKETYEVSFHCLTAFFS